MKIWTYWHERTLPDVIHECIASWKIHIPNGQIMILSDDNLHEHISPKDLPDNFNHLTPTFRSDIIRLYLLYKYGGLWLDASIKINDVWILPSSNQKDDYYAFYLYKEFPESWCIYSPYAKNRYIKQWVDQICDVTKYHPHYEQHPKYPYLRTLYPNITIWNNINYFMIYFSYLYIQSKNINFKDPFPFTTLYDFYHPLRSRSHITKFTRGGRIIYQYRYIFCVTFGLLFLVCLFFILIKSNE